MPDHQDEQHKREETAEDIFHQVSRLISEKLREGRDESSMQPARQADLDQEIKEELRRLREAIRKDEEAHAAKAVASEEPSPAVETQAPAVTRSPGEAEARPPSRPEATTPSTAPAASVDTPSARGEMSEGLRVLFGGGQPQPGTDAPQEAPGPAPKPPVPSPPPVRKEPAPPGPPSSGRPEETAGGPQRPTPPAEAAALATPAEAPTIPEPPVRPAEPPAAPTVPESPYLVTFLRGLGEAPAGLASGLPQLDDLLGGGFEPGLYVIAGPPGSGGRALLLNMLWKTVSERRTAVYYCLATGAQRIWEEMIITLSHLMNEEPLRRSDLRGGEGSVKRREEIRGLDAVLVEAFLPYVSLHERLTASPFPATAFLQEMGGSRDMSAPPDLILLDGLPQILATLQVPDKMVAGSLILELDVLLRNRGVAGLLLSEGATGSRSRWDEQGLEHLGSGLLTMRRQRGRRGGKLGPGLEQIPVRVLKQPGGLRQGTVPLVLDTASGMLAEAPEKPRAEEPQPRA